MRIDAAILKNNAILHQQQQELEDKMKEEKESELEYIRMQKMLSKSQKTSKREEYFRKMHIFEKLRPKPFAVF